MRQSRDLTQPGARDNYSLIPQEWQKSIPVLPQILENFNTNLKKVALNALNEK